MPYERIIPALDYSSQILSNVLGEKSNIELQSSDLKINEIEITARKELTGNKGQNRKSTKRQK
jgi:hypothetical protein